MRRLGAVALCGVAVVAGCGEPTAHARCSADAGCGAGQYCAAQGVCWPDAVAPVIDALSVACPTPCLRDSTVAVVVEAHDDARLAGVSARLDLAPGTSVPLTLQGGAWRADLALGDWPFPAFERPVQLTVEARDAAGNTVAASKAVGPVTRLRWAVEVAPGEVMAPGAVAVDDQGTAVLGGSNGKVYFIGPDGSAARSPVAAGNGMLTAPVVVGSGGVWVPSDDGKVYRVPADPGAAVEMVCDTGAAVKGVTLLGTGTPMASSSTGIFMSIEAPTCRATTVYPGVVGLPGVVNGNVFIGAEGRNLHSMSMTPGGFIVEGWAPPTVMSDAMGVPLALRASGDVVALTSLGAVGSIVTVTPAGVAAALATDVPVDLPADGPVVRANGDVVVPEKGKALSCWTTAGALRWRSAPLAGVPLTPLLLAGDDALVVADGRGGLTALDAAGQLRWTTQLAPVATPLRAPNLHAPPGAGRSTGYVPSAAGRLYAVILDGRLDAAAPWPKAFHDPGNTGNTSTAQPPP